MKCGAIKPSGDACENYARAGRERCGLHGGASMKGQLSVSATTGRQKYIHNLPVKDRPRFLASLNDPNLTSCASEIALLDTRLSQLAIDMEDTSQKGLTWKQAYIEFSSLLLNYDHKAKFLKGSEELLAKMREGQSRDFVWNNAYQALELRRKISETETKRDIALNQTIPKVAVADVLSNLCDAFRRNVQLHVERPVANKILSSASRELSRIIATGGMGILMSGGGPAVAGSDDESGELEDDIYA